MQTGGTVTALPGTMGSERHIFLLVQSKKTNFACALGLHFDLSSLHMIFGTVKFLLNLQGEVGGGGGKHPKNPQHPNRTKFACFTEI